MNKLQETYNFFIKMANQQFILSQEDYMIKAGLGTSLLAKAEAFEGAADHLWSKFPKEIIPTTTMRFNDIREHHLSEEDTEPKVKEV